ncbi:excinuclease ABC subunit UvrC [Carnobacteriaceae bacterium zg-ZUI252]|nr:excinuclease ABC subunit UvrC [Carnobacteriaceae bacterium zg-ZUI252]
MLQRELIEQKLKLLPDLPGCYLMKDSNGEILYVGKAKNLKNRVRSYFKQAHNGKTQKLVSQIADFETIITNTNKESLLLEVNLIKKYLPKYNIKLKDSKSYPYLKITNERHPQLIIAHTIEKDGATYFGPYPDITAATQTQQLLHKTYPLRRCGKNEKRGCFYYHLDQCIGCCDHDVPVEIYQQQIQHITQFLNGDTKDIKHALQQKMQQASENLEFERAMDYRDQIKYVEQTVEKQTILSDAYTNHDLFGFYEQNGTLSIQVFFLRQSTIIKREANIFDFYGDVHDELISFIYQFYSSQHHLLPSEIIVPDTLDIGLLNDLMGTSVKSAQRGKKKSLLDLANKNAKIALDQKLALDEMNTQKHLGAAQELANYLGIEKANVIESFDHSNTQGTHPISAMVVYVDGKPERKRYRKYKIKTVTGSNEFATTQEVIRRRYIRALKEKTPLPDLILMDGGEIQVNAAREVLEDELGLNIAVAGMVKNEKHQTHHLIYGNPLEMIALDTNSNAFRLVQRIQEEVHRFAITFHRQLRSKQSLSSQLDAIRGVGPQTRKKLLMHFKNLSDIEKASIDELQSIGINQRIAHIITEHFTLKNGID